MPKKHRLSRAHFAAFKGVRRVHGTLFTLSVAVLPESPLAQGALPVGRQGKFACVVSKKVSSRAVDRNRIKRQCREAIRPQLSKLGGRYALVFTAKREAVHASFAEVVQEIGKLLARIG